MDDTNVIGEKDLPANLNKLYLTALSAVEMKNVDYAITLLQDVVAKEPNFLDGRKLLRRAAVIKAKNKKDSGSSRAAFPSMKVAGMVKKDPVEALPELEKELTEDPDNMKLNDLLFEACQRAGMVETATFALETVRQGHPENTQLMHKLAEFYMKVDDPDKAQEVYREIQRRDPADGDAVTGERNAAARAATKSQGWGERSSREMQRDSEEARKLEQANRAAMTKEQIEAQLAEWGAKYAEDPNDLNVVKRIASLYETKEDWENALGYFEWAHQLSSGDVALEAKANAMRQKNRDAQIKAMKNYIAENPDADDIEEKKAELEAFLSEHNARQIAEAKERVERNPTDPQLRFELGMYLYNGGEFKDAIPHLQRAKGNPNLRQRVMLLLGKCFVQRNMDDMAASQFQEAIGELQIMDDTKKELLYELGLVFDKMGEKDRSLECLKEIYNIDYGYRDVAERVERSYDS
ncbi:MAG: tetratricopeptide repeat protein [Verrucomicrobiales bacterium]